VDVKRRTVFPQKKESFAVMPLEILAAEMFKRVEENLPLGP
jgi:hypothetical protein